MGSFIYRVSISIKKFNQRKFVYDKNKGFVRVNFFLCYLNSV